MNSAVALKTEVAPLLACTVSQDIHRFPVLIEDMEAELPEAWGDLTFAEASAFLDQDDARQLEFLALAITAEQDIDLGLIGDVIRQAKTHGIGAILVAHDLKPATLHALLRLGIDDFVPYPMGKGALAEAVARLRSLPADPLPQAAPLPVSSPAVDPTAPVQAPAPKTPRMGGKAAIFAVQGLAGGTGASTLAVNLAWEMATIDKTKSPSVCLMDFDLQAGTVSAYLDLPRRDMVIELLQDARSMDADAFKQALLSHEGKLSVFPAPPEVLPLDLIGPDEVGALLDLASQCFDVVVIDMPHTLLMWTETVLNRADVFFATMELDMRSAQNAMRFLKALRAESLPVEKLNFVLNRAPGLTDLSGKSRAKKLAESLGVKIATQLPDGGKQVMQAGDQGQPLAALARKNALRKEIVKLASGLYTALASDAQAAR